MKTLSLTLFLVLICSFGFAQTAQSRKILDSLKHQLSVAKSDTNQVLIMVSLADRYREPKPDSSVVFGYQAIKLARKIHFSKGEIRALASVGRSLLDLGNLPKSLEMQFEALQIAESNHLPIEATLPLNYIGSVYLNLGNYPKALDYYQQSNIINERNHQKATGLKMNIGNVYEKINQLDSALYYTNQAYQEGLQGGFINPIIFRNFGNIYVKLSNSQLAMNYYKKSLQFYQTGSRGRTKAIVLNQIAKLFQKEKQLDSSIYYAQKALTESNLTSYKQGALEAGTLLSELYETIDPKKSFQYFKIAAAAKDSLFGASQTQALQTIVVDEQVRQREIESQRLAYQNSLKQYLLLAGLGVFLVIAFILYRNNQKEKKAKNLLHLQKEEIQSTLSKLKTTQTQLIQSEKLASLGELTAGIAHEIQNPLNFVNNFSELSVELLQELSDEIKAPIGGLGDRRYGAELLADISQNLEKINHHGKRASSIVKGMLEHSRASTGVKELTDINALADEYLRLAYHGLRAKDSTFNADFKTDFDEKLPKIEVIPQDIGRVLLNLYNNAFYAVHQRTLNVGEVEPLNLPDVKTYTPSILVSTKHVDNQIIISVKDNGGGIPDNIKAKIFQPFFTTKPTGEGTGLGLSLAYDIVTKGHGGSLSVQSDTYGSNFIFTLPKTS